MHTRVSEGVREWEKGFTILVFVEVLERYF